MKTVSSCARARELLTSVAATLAATLTFSISPAHTDNLPDSDYPKIGTSDGSVPGYHLNVKKIEDGKPQPNHVTPHLFTVHTEEGVIKAYCIEIEIDVIYGSSLRIGGWKDLPGTSKFKDNPGVQAKVAWITQNSYPQTDPAEVTQIIGIAGLTEREAITATQAAIWYLTNPDETPPLDLAEGNQATKDRTGKLYDYLLGEKNGGLKEPARLTIGIKGGDLPFALSNTKTEGKVGPIRFESSRPTAKLTSELKYELIDKDSKTVDRSAIPTGTDLYLKVPADKTSGEQEFTASVTSTVQADKLFVTKSGKHDQTIITVFTDEVPVDNQGKVVWSAPQQTPPAPPTSQPLTSVPPTTSTPSMTSAPPTTSTPPTALTPPTTSAPPTISALPTGQPPTSAPPPTPAPSTSQPITPTQPSTTATSTVTVTKSADPLVVRKPGLPRTGD